MTTGEELKEKVFKILIVDDNRNNIQVLGNILRNAGFAAGFAANGEQALHILKESTSYDLVLLDINMPGMNGIELCRIIRKDLRLNDIPVIFITAYSGINSMLMGFDAGGQDYITKPFNSKELLARVNTHLQLKFKAEQLKWYARELEKLNATKDKFFSIIAHDIKNPLIGIVNLSRALLNISGRSMEENFEIAKLIHEATKQSYNLLENLLQWSRSQRDLLEINMAEFALTDLVDQCVSMSSFHAANKNITIINNVKNISVVADKNLFETVLRNLLNNAIKYTPHYGTVTIEASTKQGYIEISVTDTGIGMPKEMILKLFKIDSNLCSRPGTDQEDGTGLGLILCHEFALKLGGNITVKSDVGKGSSFRFTIPLQS